MSKSPSVSVDGNVSKLRSVREYVNRFGELVTSQVRDRFKEKGLDESGAAATLDPTPMEPPIGYNPQPSMFDLIQKQVQLELSRQGLEKGLEDFMEADDFDIGDDYEPESPYEDNFMMSAKELMAIGSQVLKDRGMMVNAQGEIVPINPASSMDATEEPARKRQGATKEPRETLDASARKAPKIKADEE